MSNRRTIPHENKVRTISHVPRMPPSTTPHALKKWGKMMSTTRSWSCHRKWNVTELTSVNTLRPRQNGRHFADDIFKCIFLNENVWISIKISLKFVPKGLINNIPALVQIMAWRRPGDKPLSEAMMINLPTDICVSRPQWVYSLASRRCWCNLKMWFSSTYHSPMSRVFVAKLLSCECHWTSLIRSQHCIRLWLGAIRQQAIPWANVDSDLCRHLASLGHKWDIKGLLLHIVLIG